MYFWYDHLDSTIFSKLNKPNGYTLLAARQGPLIINPLQVKVDYTFNDFEPLVQLVSAPQIMVADVWWGNAALKGTLEPVNAIMVETFEKIANNKTFKSMMKKMECLLSI